MNTLCISVEWHPRLPDPTALVAYRPARPSTYYSWKRPRQGTSVACRPLSNVDWLSETINQTSEAKSSSLHPFMPEKCWEDLAHQSPAAISVFYLPVWSPFPFCSCDSNIYALHQLQHLRGCLSGRLWDPVVKAAPRLGKCCRPPRRSGLVRTVVGRLCWVRWRSKKYCSFSSVGDDFRL